MTLDDDLGDHAVVESIATKGPEQLRIGLGVDTKDLAVGLDQFQLDEIVHGGTQPARGMCHATAEGQAGVSGVRYRADGSDEIVQRGLVINVSTEGCIKYNCDKE